MKPAFLLLVPLLVLRALAAPLDPAEAGDSFPLVTGDGAAAIVTDSADHPVVGVAANCLADDVSLVTGKRPAVAIAAADGPMVVIGTLGSSKFVDHLAAKGAIETRDIRGKWEACVITTISEPRPALVIAGSDPRGTAYGVFEISRAIGVSPWVWWADAAPRKRPVLRLEAGSRLLRGPAVKYRGIFLNDEDWGLQPWAAKTFEPEVGNIGPKTYAKIFELMLRLRANTIWPAMHECTTAFHQVPGNNEVADRYAIVLGSSHAEPMLRNNVGEWRKPKDRYNYVKHPEAVRDYWEERVKQRTKGESLFTLGMRGIHDSAIVGPRNRKERIETLEKIFKDQRDLLAKHLGGDLSRIGQIFCPYKEVLADYQAGLRVPDDVTLVWPDDNFGYVRHFPTPGERKRPGGSGVYYHLSYLGAPMSWLWFDSLPPAFVWSEMHRAYEQGARSLWVGNVGDLKGNEMTTEWFLDLAWNADRYGPESGMEFLKRFAATNFGAEHAADIAGLWARHQQLAFARKPEHLQWHIPLTPYQPSELTDGEINDRLEAYRALKHDAAELVKSLPERSRDAAFQLIGYPIACAAAANERSFGLELARRGHGSEPIDAAKAADREIATLTRRYNEEVTNGKWKHIMTAGGLSRRAWLRFQPAEFGRQLKDLTKAPAKEAPAAKPSPPPTDLKGPGFHERDGVISMHAGHFTGRRDVEGGGWRVVPGLGRTGDAITVLPTTLEGAPAVSYRFHVATGGPARIHVRLLPTHPIAGKQRRIAVSMDDGNSIELASDDPKPKSADWSRQVLSNAADVQAKLPGNLTSGWHELRLIGVDPGVVADKIVIDLGGLKPSYDGPPETRLPAEPATADWPAPTHADVAYGAHPRQKLDFYQATSDQPAPVVVYLHGGGWGHGDKRDIRKRNFRPLLEAGISVVSMNYRYLTHAGKAGVEPLVSWPMQDAARAVQFVRSKAAAWNLDKSRVAISGASAGACTSLWLAFHDDMADPASDDPVARESTRVCCAAVLGAQTSLDPAQMREWIPNNTYGGHAFGIRGPREEQFLEFLERRDELLPWIRKYSPIELASSDDPPVFLRYDHPPAVGEPQKDPTHSANFGVMLQDKLQALGVGCEVAYPGATDAPHDTLVSYLIDRLKPGSPRNLGLFRNLRAGRRQSVVVYGTSLSHTAEWPKALARYFDGNFPGQVTVTNSALSGKPSRWGVGNLEELVLSKNPDLVFIEFSMNDSATKHGISPGQSKANLDTMVRALREQNPEVDIVLMTMNPSWDTPEDPGTTAATDRPDLAAYYEVYRTYARENGLPLIDHWGAWDRLRRDDPARFRRWLPDGTHPIPEGSLAVTWSGIEAFLEEARAEGH